MTQTTQVTGKHVQNAQGVGALEPQVQQWIDQVYEKIETKMQWVSA